MRATVAFLNESSPGEIKEVFEGRHAAQSLRLRLKQSPQDQALHQSGVVG